MELSYVNWIINKYIFCKKTRFSKGFIDCISGKEDCFKILCFCLDTSGFYVRLFRIVYTLIITYLMEREVIKIVFTI